MNIPLRLWLAGVAIGVGPTTTSDTVRSTVDRCPWPVSMPVFHAEPTGARTPVRHWNVPFNFERIGRTGCAELVDISQTAEAAAGIRVELVCGGHTVAPRPGRHSHGCGRQLAQQVLHHGPQDILRGASVNVKTHKPRILARTSPNQPEPAQGEGGGRRTGEGGPPPRPAPPARAAAYAED